MEEHFWRFGDLRGDYVARDSPYGRPASSLWKIMGISDVGDA